MCVRVHVSYTVQQSAVVAAANHSEFAKVRRARVFVFMWESMHLGVFMCHTQCYRRH